MVGDFVNITKEEYEALLEKRIDRLCDKVADSLLWTLLSNSTPEKEIKRRETAWKCLLPKTKKSIEDRLKQLCVFYENPKHCKYNCFKVSQALCHGDFSDFNDEPKLIEIGNYLQEILRIIQ